MTNEQEKKFYVLRETWIYDVLQAPGDEVMLTPARAKMYLSSGAISETKPTPPKKKSSASSSSSSEG
ncbi:hypothetical protein [Acuticoccus sediminis]|nr:hypothetical protein [Acuticoccus sediminis]